MCSLSTRLGSILETPSEYAKDLYDISAPCTPCPASNPASCTPTKSPRHRASNPTAAKKESRFSISPDHFDAEDDLPLRPASTAPSNNNTTSDIAEPRSPLTGDHQTSPLPGDHQTSPTPSESCPCFSPDRAPPSPPDSALSPPLTPVSIAVDKQMTSTPSSHSMLDGPASSSSALPSPIKMNSQLDNSICPESIDEEFINGLKLVFYRI